MSSRILPKNAITSNNCSRTSRQELTTTTTTTVEKGEEEALFSANEQQYFSAFFQSLSETRFSKNLTPEQLVEESMNLVIKQNTYPSPVAESTPKKRKLPPKPTPIVEEEEEGEEGGGGVEKRQKHLRSEQRRRNHIKQGFQNLCQVVPTLREAGKLSKSAMLDEAVRWMRKLKCDIAQWEQEIKTLEQALPPSSTVSAPSSSTVSAPTSISCAPSSTKPPSLPGPAC